MERTGQRRTIDVDRGLFLVRYIAADDTAQPPQVKVAPEPTSVQHLEVILHPDQEEPVLSCPGACVVVRATMPGQLAVEVWPSRRNGSVAATVNIEPLTQGDTAPAVAPTGGREQGVPQRAEDLRILGHIAGAGDVYTGASEWLAGPMAPSRIEGISIDWSTKPSGLNVGYSVSTAQPLPISGRMVELGVFAGTRGRAMALTGLAFELSGPEAPRYQFAVDGLFLGAPVMRASGQRVVLGGPTGREPLVGLRVAIEEVPPPNSRRQRDQATARSARSSGRVRVFRSSPRREKSAT